MGLPDFKALKERVGIDDVAYSLGYRINRAAGVGRYIEMIQPDGKGGHIDSIVIRNPNNKVAQYYFRHSRMGGGDVVAFITEKINLFQETGRNKWEIAGKVLRRLANEPVSGIDDSSYLGRSSGRQGFDPERWETQPMTEHLANGMSYLSPRGLSAETLNAFAPHIVRVRDRQSEKFKDFNIGFPYHEPGSDTVVGYEIRGFAKYKIKAAGTNSSTAAWIADLSVNKNPYAIRNVYFGESAYDIMAFYQANKPRIDTETSVFVSIGGSFSDRQIKGIMNHYANAKAVDCFDNDLAGQVYGIRMAGLLDNKSLHLVRTNGGVRLSVEGKDILLPPGKENLTELSRHVRFSGRVRQWKPPSEFKDWNDVVMNKPWKHQLTVSKFQRDENLERRRNGMKR